MTAFDIFRSHFTAFGPAEGIIIHIRQVQHAVIIQIINGTITIRICIETDLHPRDTRLPRFRRRITGIIFSPGYGVIDNPADPTIFSHTIKPFTPVDNVDLAEEQMHGLGQDRAFFRTGKVVPGMDINIRLRLRIEFIARRHVPAVVRRNGAAVIHNTGHTGGFMSGKIHFDHQPLEERKYFFKGIFPHMIGRLGLIDRAITKSYIDILFGDTTFVGIRKTILIGVQENPSFQFSKPAEGEDVP
ncbi:MAG: hypothetical protein BWY71_02105 [Planctomycetes bacterium ADurb.Bin412]|nr:MAG: hypothetical protein BWY71_02105 [Planctomycetes bacterium ADurb.Bin412]